MSEGGKCAFSLKNKKSKIKIPSIAESQLSSCFGPPDVLLPNSVTVLVLLKPGGLRQGGEGRSTVCTKFGTGGEGALFRGPRFKP